MGRNRSPPEIKQRDLFKYPCPVCRATGRVPWAVNLPRGGAKGWIEYQTCELCLGQGGFMNPSPRVVALLRQYQKRA